EILIESHDAGVQDGQNVRIVDFSSSDLLGNNRYSGWNHCNPAVMRQPDDDWGVAALALTFGMLQANFECGHDLFMNFG
ncbi:MAG: hypothetical protein K2H70_01590, partial [Bacteroidales bacterium]|nr:hypothetical protein [Bacteroidales bacterium]